MKMLGPKYSSITVRLIVPMLAILFLQALFFFLSIFYCGTIDEFKNLSFGKLNSQILSEKDFFQREIRARGSSLPILALDVQEIANPYLNLEEYASSNNTINPQTASEFLDKTVDYLISTIRHSRVTGAFIILNAKDVDYPGIYIRDVDSALNFSDNSDFRMVRGLAAIARKSGVALSNDWAPYFHITKDDEFFDSFRKPILAVTGKTVSSIEDFGYWSKPYTINDKDVISYSIPLLDKNGQPYGVVGIDLTLDYLADILREDETLREMEGTYFLTIKKGNSLEFENLLTSEPEYGEKLLDKSNIISLLEYKEPSIYKVADKGMGLSTWCSSIQYLSLCNRNVFFEADRWVLLGVVKEANLLKSMKQLKINILISLITIVNIGVIGSILIGMALVRPITTLANKLKKSDPGKAIVLGKTNIKEIDDLALAVESLSNKVAESASKLTKIVGMVKKPIAAFEHVLDENRVFCTDGFFDIVGIERLHRQNNYIPSSSFYRLLEEIRKCPEENLEDIYRYTKNGRHHSWIRIKIQEDNGKALGIIEDATEEISEKKRLEYERDYDVLTHLMNRRAFHEQVRKRLEEGESLKIGALIMWDLDNLKYINDSYGHDFGDEYIRTTAEILREISVNNGIVGRMSGDEFYAFISGFQSEDEIREIVRGIQDRLYNKTLSMPDGTALHIRASVGMSWYPKDSRNYYELVKYSDFAMYQVKNNVKGRICEFDLGKYLREPLTIHEETELIDFIEEERVEYLFQPIVDSATGSIFAYEALMHPKMGVYRSPADILKMAESQSRLDDIERITWFKALEAFEEKIDKFKGSKIFINSIPDHMLSYNDIQRIEAKFGKYLHHVVLEISGGEYGDEIITRKKRRILEKWNSQIALDNFGSGYSSEIALLILSPDYIKIDRAIIKGIGEDLNRQRLVQSILSYARDRFIKVIAVGVETKDDMDILISYGVDYLQGNYVGKPKKDFEPIAEEVIKEIRRLSPPNYN